MQGQGVLSPPRRGPNGHRLYDAPTATRLEFVRSAQGARLTLVEIATILELRDEGAKPCAHVHGLLAAKLVDVQARRRELAALETDLRGLINRSHRLDPADCTDTQICHIIATPGS